MTKHKIHYTTEQTEKLKSDLSALRNACRKLLLAHDRWECVTDEIDTIYALMEDEL